MAQQIWPPVSLQEGTVHPLYITEAVAANPTPVRGAKTEKIIELVLEDKNMLGGKFRGGVNGLQGTKPPSPSSSFAVDSCIVAGWALLPSSGRESYVAPCRCPAFRSEHCRALTKSSSNTGEKQKCLEIPTGDIYVFQSGRVNGKLILIGTDERCCLKHCKNCECCPLSLLIVW